MKKRIAKKLQARVAFLEKALVAKNTVMVELRGRSYDVACAVNGIPGYPPVKNTVVRMEISNPQTMTQGFVVTCVERTDLAKFLRDYHTGNCSVKVS